MRRPPTRAFQTRRPVPGKAAAARGGTPCTLHPACVPCNLAAAVDSAALHMGARVWQNGARRGGSVGSCTRAGSRVRAGAERTHLTGAAARRGGARGLLPLYDRRCCAHALCCCRAGLRGALQGLGCHARKGSYARSRERTRSSAPPRGQFTTPTSTHDPFIGPPTVAIAVFLKPAGPQPDSPGNLARAATRLPPASMIVQAASQRSLASDSLSRTSCGRSLLFDVEVGSCESRARARAPQAQRGSRRREASGAPARHHAKPTRPHAHASMRSHAPCDAAAPRCCRRRRAVRAHLNPRSTPHPQPRTRSWMASTAR